MNQAEHRRLLEAAAYLEGQGIADDTGRADPGLSGGLGLSSSSSSQDEIVQQLLQQKLWEEMLNFQRGQFPPGYNELIGRGAPDVPAQAGAALQRLGAAIKPDVEGRNALDRTAALPGQLLSNTADFWGGLLQLREPQVDAITRSLIEGLQPSPAASPFTTFPFNTIGAQKAGAFVSEKMGEEDWPLQLAESLQVGDVVPGLGMGAGILGRKSLNKLLSEAKGDVLRPSLSSPPAVTGQRISTRFPKGASATENPYTENLIIDTATMARDPALAAKNARLLADYPTYVPPTAGSPAPYRFRPPEWAHLDNTSANDIINQMMEKSRENLRYLYDIMPPGLRKRARLWYEGANKIANEFSGRFGTSIETASGVIAALSPQMDWFQNVAFAERVLDTVKHHANDVFDDDMYNTAKAIFLDPKKKDTRIKRENALIIDHIKGKSLNDIEPLFIKGKELNINRLRGLWVRSFDEVYRDKTYRSISPEGDFLDVHMREVGEGPQQLGWGGNEHIGKAVSVILDPSYENITRQMGDAHKVRNFYNNITDPDSPFGDVTIDTHAISASQFMPLSGGEAPVAHNLSSSVKTPGTSQAATSAPLGVKGTYGYHADTYRDVAGEVGELPRAYQSVVWEQIRSLFTPQFKSRFSKDPALRRRITSLWEGVGTKKMSVEEARKKTIDIVSETTGVPGGWKPPVWSKDTLKILAGATGLRQAAGAGQRGDDD
jgi:hypothetical protein